MQHYMWGRLFVSAWLAGASIGWLSADLIKRIFYYCLTCFRNLMLTYVQSAHLIDLSVGKKYRGMCAHIERR